MADRTLLSLSLYTLLASNRSGIFIAYFPVFLVQFQGASVAAALAFTSAAYVGGSLVGPLAGRWSDRLGRRRPFLLGAEAAALPLYLAIPFLPSYWASGSAFVAGTIVLSLGAPALSAFVADLTKATERGRAYGLLNATSSVGGILGFVVVGGLVQFWGLRTIFFFVASVMVATVVVLLSSVPDIAGSPTVGRQPIRELQQLVGFSFAVSTRSLGAGAIGAFFGVYATTLGGSYFDVSLIAIAGLATLAVTSLPLGKFVDRSGEIRGLLWGTIITTGGIVGFLLASTWWLLLPAQGLRYAGFALLNPAMLSWVARLAPAGRRAEYLGVFSLINSTLWSLGPFAGSLAFQAGGPVALFGLSIGVTVASLVAIEGFQWRSGRGTLRSPTETGASPPAA